MSPVTAPTPDPDTRLIGKDPGSTPGQARLTEPCQRNEEDIIMDNYYPETRTIDQQVKDAVYCWVLVNHPEVIEDARELVTA